MTRWETPGFRMWPWRERGNERTAQIMIRDRIKVLWMDDEIYDDEYTRDSAKIREIERGGDITVQVALDGTQALQYLAIERPDVIILDVFAPPGEELGEKDTEWGYTTGLEVLRRIRGDLGLDIPVIILSAYPVNPAEVILLGATTLLAKPVTMAILAGLIRRHVSNERLKGEVRR